MITKGRGRRNFPGCSTESENQADHSGAAELKRQGVWECQGEWDLQGWIWGKESCAELELQESELLAECWAVRVQCWRTSRGLAKEQYAEKSPEPTRDWKMFVF